MNTHEYGTSTKESSFDAKTILPEKKAEKSLPKLLELISSMKKVIRFLDLQFALPNFRYRTLKPGLFPSNASMDFPGRILLSTMSTIPIHPLL